MEPLLILSINNFILSKTKFLSLNPIILTNIAPAITPNSKIHTENILIFFLGKIYS